MDRLNYRKRDVCVYITQYWSHLHFLSASLSSGVGQLTSGEPEKTLTPGFLRTHTEQLTLQENIFCRKIICCLFIHSTTLYHKVGHTCKHYAGHTYVTHSASWCKSTKTSLWLHLNLWRAEHPQFWGKGKIREHVQRRNYYCFVIISAAGNILQLSEIARNLFENET